MKKIYFTYKGHEFRLDEYDYVPGSPGKLTGPPENCFPPEPAELEIIKLYVDESVLAGEFKEVPMEVVDLINELTDDDFNMTALEHVELSLQKEEPESEPRDID